MESQAPRIDGRQIDAKRMLSIEEAAFLLGIAPRTLYNRCGRRAENPFPVRPKRIGRRVLFDRKDLEQYIDSL